MHINRGRPLISAEHEPHFPALQFQRTARSGACSAWILWTASRTTIPSPASRPYSCSAPERRVPRKIRKRRCSLTSRPFLDELREVGGQRGLRLPAGRHPVSVALHDHLFALDLRVRVGMIAARVTAPAFFTLERRAPPHLPDGDERTEVERRVPPRVVLPAARHRGAPGGIVQPCELGERLLESGAVAHRSEERRVGKECRSRWSPYH